MPKFKTYAFDKNLISNKSGPYDQTEWDKTRSINNKYMQDKKIHLSLNIFF